MVVAQMLLSVLVSAASPADPAPTLQEPPAPVERCTPVEDVPAELSGLASRGEELLAVADGGTSVRVVTLGPDCAVTGELTDPLDPRDVEDMAVDAAGTVWLGDIGDNDAQRDTVAVIGLRPDEAASLHRLTYPDGPRDAEALLLGPDGTLLVVTKSVSGAAGVYSPGVPIAELASPGPTPMQQLGTVIIAPTVTPGGPIGSLGSVLVTGGAMNADGTVAALRTYTDAYLYPVSGGDVVAALAGDPVRVPLAEEPQGEAIAFTATGDLLSASEQVPGLRPPVRVVVGASALAASAPQPAQAEPSAEPTPGPDGGAGAGEDGAADDGIPTWQAGVLAVLAAGTLVWLVGLLSRRRR